MNFIFFVIETILIIAALVCFLWSILGIPTGLVCTIFYFISKDKDEKLKFKKLIRIFFAGVIGLIIVGLLWSIILFAQNFFGLQIIGATSHI